MGSKDITKQQPEGKVRFWYRDNFFITNDKSYLDPHAFNKSLDDLWWSSPLEPNQIQKVFDNCLTLGVYWVPQTEAEMRGWFSHNPSVMLIRCTCVLTKT